MSLIGRATAALFFSLLCVEASAATRTSERGVTVVRGATTEPARLAAPAPAARPACPEGKVSLTAVWPARRFRQQGFWSGDGLVTASMRAANRRTTYGFYADRLAAGL
ncbi:MAG: hypothetical protein U5J99_12795 [Parvularculaceae bacterium]|nr:hypothetical protein [Parvularculaceae bacterium]